jgi:hypothetical protein
MLLTLAAALALQGAPAADTLPSRPDPASAAYHDPFARELVSRARSYRRSTDLEVRAYRTLARERVAVGLRMLSRERTLASSEKAARIDWRREGPVRIDVLGRRERDPDGDGDLMKETAESLGSDFHDLAFDPAEERLRFGVMDTTWVPHPLAAGSEAFYRYRSGDTLTVRLPGGKAVRVYELRVEPRRAGKPLVSGSLWLDDGSYGVVRSLLRLNAPLTEQIRAEMADDGDSGKRSVTVSAGTGEGRRRRPSRWSVIPEVRLDVRYMNTEYALVEGRWWMPASTALEGTVSVGSRLAVPVRFERSYTEYHVEGDAPPAPGQLAAEPPAPVQGCKEGEKECVCRRSSGACRVFDVHVPEDRASLERAAELPPPIETGAPLMSGKEANDLAREIDKVAATPWLFTQPSLRQAPVVVRYNRVEALSLGTRATVDFGPLQVDGTARIATSNAEPDLELGLRRESPKGRWRLAGYYRLAAMDPAQNPLGIGNSLGAFFFGGDQGDYFRATGAELTGRPPRAERPWYEWRLFAEQQRGVSAETDFSTRGWFDDGWEFRPNPRADRADQVGASLLLRPVMGRQVLGTTWGVDVGVEGQAGDFRFARPTATVRMGTPLPFGLAGALEAAGGTSFGDVPVQSLWRVGGVPSVRGYDASSSVGNAFWRGRGEVSSRARSARIALFTDVGRAGDRESLTLSDPLWSVGAGASLLEGMVRLDLARAMRGDTGWRLHLYLDGAL